MDPVWLARLQFAITVGFHFIFPPLTIGLGWLLVMIEWKGWRHGDEDCVRLGKFFGKLFGITFAMGVATGIVMEFQFGTNWAQYSKFVGDVFGAPLAAEGVFAFFLESSFLGLYLFGRNRLPKWAHWFSSLMVAVGATLSAFWIIVANSWQQTPAGYKIVEGAMGRHAELTDFWAAVFNPSTIHRYGHTIDAALVSGAFFMMGVAAWMLLKKRDEAAAAKAFRLALIFGFVVSMASLFPTGHEHARQVARTQPEKFAAIEGLYRSQTRAPIVIFAFPTSGPPPQWKSYIEIPPLLSLMAFGDVNAHVQGIDAFKPEDLPPLLPTFATFHIMVGLGLLFIVLTGWGVLMLWLGRLWSQRWFLRLMVWAAPLPVVACEVGWLTAEIGRQPWIVYHEMRVSEAISQSVSAGEILFSMTLLCAIYTLLGALWLYLMFREIRKGPEARSAGPAARA